MFMEYVNIFGLKLYVMQDWFKKNSDYSDIHLSDKSWTLKQHLAIMNYYIKISMEYLDTLERGKPDETLYLNLNEISEKIALHSEKENYQNMLKQFQVSSQDLMQKFKTCKNKSTKNISEYLMDQFFLITRHFGAAEENLKISK
jgi:hypothetical protein